MDGQPEETSGLLALRELALDLHWSWNHASDRLWKKYGRKLGQYTFFTNERLYGQYGLAKLPMYSARSR